MNGCDCALVARAGGDGGYFTKWLEINDPSYNAFSWLRLAYSSVFAEINCKRAC